ncbi:MAG: FHA domain-containing protein, partial [Acidimicrobiales bacterium]
EVAAIPDELTGPSEQSPETMNLGHAARPDERERLPASRAATPAEEPPPAAPSSEAEPAAVSDVDTPAAPGHIGPAGAGKPGLGAWEADSYAAWFGDAPSKAPGPTVSGAKCANSHFNHRDAEDCRLCGVGMAQAGKVTVMDERPPLGVLVMPDGTTFTLDGDYVIGRRPLGDGNRWIIVDDKRVSRRHAAILLRDWDVVIEDLGSSNGTQVKNPGADDWVRVAPGSPVVLENGGQLSVGSAVIVYDSTLRRPA